LKVLGIETSCDETAAAVVEDGQRILSNVVASQVEMHARYGGVVPEVASRQHLLTLVPVVRQALEQAQVTLEMLDGIAVTMGPGLAGALLVGLNLAKALAFSLGKPLVGVNHLEAHVYANWLGREPDPAEKPGFPLVCLIASGGHTDLVSMEEHGRFTLLGRTRDDAVGEAFDKVARVLGLGYPGGPAVQRASQGALGTQKLPRAWLKNTHDFSFSGLKTALLRHAQEQGLYPAPASAQGAEAAEKVREAAAAFQESAVDVMVSKTLAAASSLGAEGVLLGGGVIANTLLRERFLEASLIPVLIPPVELCTDNAAMVAACGFHLLRRDVRHGLDLDVIPNLKLG